MEDVLRANLEAIINSLRYNVGEAGVVIAPNQFLISQTRIASYLRQYVIDNNYGDPYKMRIVVLTPDSKIKVHHMPNFKQYVHCGLGSPIWIKGDTVVTSFLDIMYPYCLKLQTQDINKDAELSYMPATLSQATHAGLKPEVALLLTFLWS